MPDNNGNRTIIEWLKHIDESNVEAHNRILDKLDTKSDKTECDKDQKRLEKVEDKHTNLAVKVAGIAGGITIAVMIVGWVIGG